MDIRSNIINAYREMAARQGLNGVTMDQLAAAAGVSKRTLYRYFSSKEEVIEAALDEFMHEMSAYLTKLFADTSDPEKFFQEVLTRLYNRGNFIISQQGLSDLRLYYPQLWQKIDNFRQSRLREVMGKVLGQMDLDVNPLIVSTVVRVSISEVINPEFILANGLTFEEAASGLSRLLLRMIGGEKVLIDRQ